MICNHISLFYGLINFCPILFLLDILLIIHFIFSWFKSYKKTGLIVDYWHLILFILFFIPLLIMYPFNASIYNISAVGDNYFVIYHYIDIAYIISIIGYLSLWIGRYLFDISKTRNPLIAIYAILKPIEKIAYFNLKKQLTLFLLLTINISLYVIIIYFQINTGNYLFNPREFFLQHGELRPIYNLLISLYPITLVYLYLFKVNPIILAIYILLGFLLGTRGPLIWGLVTILALHLFLKGKNIKKIPLILILALLLILIIYIESLRHGELNPLVSLSIGFYKLFYGNTFSDTRDFAWILSYWDGNYLLGKTYLAGLISFIPRYLSEFRSEWAISVVTDKIVGFNPAEHPGLRPGMFGEVYLNFGILGVIILGIIAGYFLRLVDINIKKILKYSDNIKKIYSKTIIFFFISKFFITAGFWSFYVFMIINIVIYIVNSFFSFKKGKMIK